MNKDDELGIIRIPRRKAQADYNITKRKVIDVNGKTYYKAITTVNDEKIADTCVQVFQRSELNKRFDYLKLKEAAVIDLEPKFQKYNLIESINNTKKENKEIEKKRKIAIEQYVREYVEENAELTFEIDFEEFMLSTGIKSATRIGNALKLLINVQSKSFYEWNQPVLTEDFSEIEHRLTRVGAIPSMSVVLDGTLGEQFQSLTAFANSDLRNKRKHIKKLRFELSKTFLSSVLGVGTEYTSGDRKIRDNFTSSYSYRLHLLIGSIEKVQSSPDFNLFTFEQLQKKLGTDYAEYKHFKRSVLVPAIEDLNKHSEFNIEIKERRAGNRINGSIQGVSFIIRRDRELAKHTKFGVGEVAYYIASRLFYFSTTRIDNLIAFAKHIEREIQTSAIAIYDGKYAEEWKDEAIKAFTAEAEIIKYFEEHMKYLSSLGIKYDEKRMCIVKIDIDEFGTEEAPKIKLIATAEYKVTNPMTSVVYLDETLRGQSTEVFSLIDFLPYEIATTTDGWVKINDTESYAKNLDTIKRYAAQKKLDYFRFESNSIFREIFYMNIMRENFRELTDEFRELVRRLSE